MPDGGDYVSIQEDRAVAVPASVRLRLARAAVQAIVDRHGIDLVHIKGDAIDPIVARERPPGSDVDVLVRPEHIGRFHAALSIHGWTMYSSFRHGSPFGHAQTYLHATWGYLDVHRFFPGIGLHPSAAFAHLWAERTAMGFGGVSCAVPSIPGQATILVLNDARRPKSMRRLPIEVDSATWTAISREVTTLRAEVAFDAAIGDIERHRGARTYRLWKVTSQGGGRVEEWWARVVAAPTVWARIALLARVPLVNVEHLSHALGRRPTVRDIAVEFVARPLRGARELWQSRRRKDS